MHVTDSERAQPWPGPTSQSAHYSCPEKRVFILTNNHNMGQGVRDPSADQSEFVTVLPAKMLWGAHNPEGLDYFYHYSDWGSDGFLRAPDRVEAENIWI